MPYDLFISYARRDNENGRVTELKRQIEADYWAFTGRELRCFFDVDDIHVMDDWKHRILGGLRESQLLLACLSPSYLTSEPCAWEFNEYLKLEISRTAFGEGVASIYFVEVPGWEGRNFDRQCSAWVAELRRRHVIDLRAWFHSGEACLREKAVRANLHELNIQLATRLQRGARANQSLGNVYAHNLHFIGRSAELRRLREAVALGKVGILTAVHGLGGIGKTALAIEYAHAFAHEYGGGRWQVQCEGKEDLGLALSELIPALGLPLNAVGMKDGEKQSERVMVELHRLARDNEPQRCLLILDNVDKLKLLEPAQTQRLPAEDWLHVIITTRLGGTELHGSRKDRVLLPVDELPEADAMALIESYQPEGKFLDDAEREAARSLVRLLGGYTLAVESAAVYLGQFAEDVSCASFLTRLRKEGLNGVEKVAIDFSEGSRHGEKRLEATLAPTLERLGEAERLVLKYASLLPADHIVLTWIKILVSTHFPEYGSDAEPGYPDPWNSLLRKLLGLRLLQMAPSGVGQLDAMPNARMHRLLQALCREKDPNRLRTLRGQVFDLAKYMADAEMLYRQALDEAEREQPANEVNVALARADLGRLLLGLGRFEEAERLIRQALVVLERSIGEYHPNTLTVVNDLAVLLQETGDYAACEPLLRRALAGYEQALGPEHPGMLTTVNNLAALLHAKGDTAAAEPLLRRALAGYEQALGPAHPATLTSAQNLAALMQDLGDYAAAEPLLRRALAGYERALGPTHPETCSTVQNLIGLLEKMGRADEAEPLREVYIDRMSSNPNATPLAQRQLALECFNRGDYTRAEVLLRQVLAKAFEIPGTNCHLARALIMAGREAEAREAIKGAGAHYTEATAYVVGRMLWFQVVFAWLDGASPAPFLGRLKTALQAENAQMEWTMDPVLAHLHPKLSPEAHALLTNLVAALSDSANISKLDEFAEWRAAPPLPLD